MKKLKKRKYIRKVKTATRRKATLSKSLTTAVNKLPAAMQNIPQRMLMLNQAAEITGVSRMAIHGDPLLTFEGVAALKRAFWNHLPVTLSEEDMRQQNSAAGHAIDSILGKLGRLATSPSQKMKADTLLDLAAYTAILYEIAARQESLDAE